MVFNGVNVYDLLVTSAGVAKYMRVYCTMADIALDNAGQAVTRAQELVISREDTNNIQAVMEQLERQLETMRDLAGLR